MAVYCVSQHAIAAFTDCLRLDLAGSGVGVACIESGKVETTLPATIKPPLLPEDIAQMVLFILMQPRHVNVNRILVMPANQFI